MGITIDESKRNLSYAIKWKDRPTDESMMLAIETMRKYEKIEQILDDCDLEAWEILEKVKEVVVDDRN